MRTVFIGLGSNLANPIKQIKTALSNLNNIPNTRVIKISSFYQSKPLGPQNQPDFINAVVELTTELSADNLLDELQKIEKQQGRVRREKWGPRTIDLDILLYNNEIISTSHLQIPHPGIKSRAFVLYPLLEIAPQLYLPDGEFVKDLADKCKDLVEQLTS